MNTLTGGGVGGRGSESESQGWTTVRMFQALL